MTATVIASLVSDTATLCATLTACKLRATARVATALRSAASSPTIAARAPPFNIRMAVAGDFGGGSRRFAVRAPLQGEPDFTNAAGLPRYCVAS